MNIQPNNAPENQNFVSKDFYENLDERDKDEYPIILYEPAPNSEGKISLINIQKENMSLKNFANFKHASEFIEKLVAESIGLILIVSAEYNEKNLLQQFECLKELNFYRLSTFEEEPLFKKLFQSISSLNIQSEKAYKFFTRKEFNNEASINHTEDEVLVMKEIGEMAKEFKEELSIWYDSSLKFPSKEELTNSVKVDPESLFNYDFKALSDKIYLSPNYPYHLILIGENEATKVIEKLGHFKGLLRIYVCPNDVWNFNIFHSKVEKLPKNLKDLVSKIQEEVAKRTKKDLPAFITTSDACNKKNIYDFHIFLKKFNFKNREQAQKDFIDLAKKVHIRNEKDIQPLCEFEGEYTNYDETKIFKWYTKDSPVFRVVNNCLRIATTDSITYARFMFKDLEQAIQEHYKRESKNFSGVVYRTAFLSQDEWANLERNQGQEVEMLGFLSTSKNKKKAMGIFTSKKVLVEIIIPPLPELDAQGFADLSKISELKEEEEILFNVRSRFQILKTGMEKHEDNWEYRYVLLLYGDPSLSSCIMRNKPSKRIKMKSPSDANGNSSWKCDDCGEFAEEVYFKEQELERKKSVHKNCPECFQLNKKRKLDFPLLAEENPKILWFDDTGDYEMAALDFQDDFPRDSKNLGQGDLFLEVKKYKECLEYCKRRLEQILTKRGREQERLRLYDLIGRSSKCLSLGENAKEFLSNHLTITKLIFGKEHPKTAISSHNLAVVYIFLKENGNAVQHFEGSLKVTESFYHKKSLKTVKALTTLAAMYMISEERNKAIEKFEEALAITLEINGRKHSNTAAAFNNLSIAYQSLQLEGDKKTMKYFIEALNASQPILRRKNPSKFAAYNLLGAVFWNFLEDKHQENEQDGLEQFLRHLKETKSFFTEKVVQKDCSIQNLAVVCKILGEIQKGLEPFLEPQGDRVLTYGKDEKSSLIFSKALKNLNNKIQEHKGLLSECSSVNPSISGEICLDSNALESSLSCTSYSLNEDQSVHEMSKKTSRTNLHEQGLMNLEEQKNPIKCGFAQKCFENPRSKKPGDRTEIIMIKTLHTTLANFQKSRGKLPKALEHADKALNIEEFLHGKNHSELASFYTSLILMNARLYGDKIALESHRDDLESREAIHDEKNHFSLLFYDDLALTYEHSKEYSKALDCRKKAIEILEGIEKEQSGLAYSFNNLALTYEALEKYKEAQKNFEKAREIMNSICGESHLDIATLCNSIGSIKLILGQFKEAVADFSKARDITIRLKGENHSSVAASELYLARAHQNQSNHEEELKSCEKGLKIYKFVHGENNSRTAAAFHSLGMAFYALENFEEAEKNYARASKISKFLHGILHADTAASFNSLANLYLKQGKIMTALEFSLKAFEITKFIYGENHSETAFSLNNLAVIYEKKGDHKTALEYYQRARNIAESIYGEGHSQNAKFESNIGKVLKKEGKSKEAFTHFKKAFSICRSNREHPPTEIAKIMSNFASMHDNLKDRKTIELLKEAIEISQQYLGNDHSETQALNQNLALAHKSLGDYKEAGEALLNAHQQSFQNLRQNRKKDGWD